MNVGEEDSASRQRPKQLVPPDFVEVNLLRKPLLPWRGTGLGIIDRATGRSSRCAHSLLFKTNKTLD
jgi:hypothetical protein